MFTLYSITDICTSVHVSDIIHVNYVCMEVHACS